MCKKTNLLNDFFVSQTSLDDSTPTLPNTDLPDNNTLHNIIITVEVSGSSICSRYSNWDSSVPDNTCIYNRLLKEIAYPISKPLHDLFNYSLSHGIFSDLGKQANLSPLYKTDDHSLVCNCRPNDTNINVSILQLITDSTPTFLPSLVPLTVENTPRYNLRDSQNIMPLLTRTHLYYNLFLQSCFRE